METKGRCQRLAKRQIGVIRSGVNLHAVAGGKDHRLVRNAAFPQLAKRLDQLRLGKRKALPQLNRRRMVAQTCDNNGHDLLGGIMNTGQKVGTPKSEDDKTKRDDRQPGVPAPALSLIHI